MPTPTELLEKKIHRHEAALRAFEAETAIREAELQELKQSLQKLQVARNGIRGAIDDALSDSPIKSIEPTELIEMAVEGNMNNNPFKNGNMTAMEAVVLALTSLRSELGSKGLVKSIVRTAVHTSLLDAEDVIKSALETFRGELRVQDVVMVSMRAARNSRNITAAEIIRPAVEISMDLGIETPLIIKEMFVAGVRRDPVTVKSSLLSVLGCAMGLGMTYRDVKDLMKDFSKEVKHGAHVGEPADGKRVRFVTPPVPLDPNLSNPHQPQRAQSPNDPPDDGTTINVSEVQATGDDSSAAATSGPSKRSASDEIVDQAEVRPSKKLKFYIQIRRQSNQ